MSCGSGPPEGEGSESVFAVGRRFGSATIGDATGAIDAISAPDFSATTPADA